MSKKTRTQENPRESDDSAPVNLAEAHNTAEWLEARLHTSFTVIADEMYGYGYLSRDERIVLSSAIGAGLDEFRSVVETDAPQLFDRGRYNMPGEDEPVYEADAQTQELEIEGDYVSLIEAAVQEDGTVPIKIIRAGWGSSGYYPKEVLVRDGPRIFPRGRKMFWNHPTRTEEKERPEGDLNFFSAVLDEDAYWDENHPRGPGLYSRAKVFDDWQSSVNEMADYIGTSIRALGTAKRGEAEGRKGTIIQSLDEGISVDFVTEPGAGGEVITMFEAARPAQSKHETVRESNQTIMNKKRNQEIIAESEDVKEKSVTSAELAALHEQMSSINKLLEELQESNETLSAENQRLQERQTLSDAADMVRESLPHGLHAAVCQRLTETLVSTAPIKDGELDAESFASQIEEAVKAEQAYIKKITGRRTVTGMSESFGSKEESDSDQSQRIEEAKKKLAKSFSEIGLGKEAVEFSVNGR